MHDVTTHLEANAVDLIVHLGWVEGRRRVTSVREVPGTIEAGQVVSNELWRPDEDGLAVPAAPPTPEFATALETTCRSVLGPAELARVIETDGELSQREFSLASAEAIQSGVWGQAFPAPAFIGDFRVQAQRLVGEKHLKLKLTGSYWSAEAMLFNRDVPLPERIQAVYRLDVNIWNGQRSLQLTLDHWTDAATA